MGKPKVPHKRSPRTKSKGKRKNSVVSARLKELWQTPEFRERMRQRDLDRIADAKAHPENHWRRGVPNGMRKAEAEALWAKAREQADRFIQIMKDNGELPSEEHEIVDVEVRAEDGTVTKSAVAVPTTDAGKAERAMREVAVIAFGPSTQNIKIQAINTLLAYTKSKPESKQKLTLNKAEDFLDAISAEDE